jgi:hypothetical protein
MGPNEKVIVFEAKTEFRTFKQVPGQERPETGEITGAGVMNSTFETLPGTIIIYDNEFDSGAGTGLLIIRHTDRYKSKNATHHDSALGTTPDSFEVEYTIVVVIAPPLQTRVTFEGPLSAGTGMFAGATGVLNGHGFRVASSDPDVDLAFEGRVGGEIHLAPGA